MSVSVRSLDRITPEYSLTGDLLAFLRCGLQYRMYSRGSLPPSLPVQQWFGEFIHGCMEEAFAQWRAAQGDPSSPYANHIVWNWTGQLKAIELNVHKRLFARGLTPPPGLLYENLGRDEYEKATETNRGVASKRFEQAINTWGTYLFPLVEDAEVRLRGSALMPAGATVRSNRFSVTGVVDVLSSVRLRNAPPNNAILRRLRENERIRAAMDESSSPFEIIVDYKGMRRPPCRNLPEPDRSSWDHQAWQLQTYAWLRRRQNPNARVLAGVLIYMNELVPSETDLEYLVKDLAANTTDILPPRADEGQLARRDTGGKTDYVVDPDDERVPAAMALSVPFREDRSFRLVEVDEEASSASLERFRTVVGEIEEAVAAEVRNGDARSDWPTYIEERTCTACDFKYHCPARGGRDTPKVP